MSNRLKLSAEDVYNRLISDDIFNEKGKITFSFSGIDVDIETNDIIGHIMQAWLKSWFLKNNIEFGEPKDTQKFPDFYLNLNDLEDDLLEVKAFNYKNSPGFDIANFESYCESVETKPYRFHANYLIFAYRMVGTTITIENLWLKNIWEITSSMKDFPLTVQNKRGTIYNIRPTKWYSTSKRSRDSFSSLEDFIIACYNAILDYPKSDVNADDWIYNVVNNYNDYYVEPLNINL